jgi:enterochelin esterase family protein
MNIDDDLRPTYASPMDVETYRLLRLDKHGPKAVNGHSNLDVAASINHEGDAGYQPCPEAHPSSDVPKGEILSICNWECELYPNTLRRIWIYIPADLPASRSDVGLIQFNDGHIYLDKEGSVRAAFVLDSLHAAGEIDPTVGVFLTPGRPAHIKPEADEWSETEWNVAAEQRSIEYDSLRSDYGQFLLEELLPFVEQTADVRLTDDPKRRICCGASSGGIAAFTAAWHFPSKFSRVLSHVGSYTNIKGGHNYPWLVRNTPRKDIKVFLQSGENDAATLVGDLPLANQTMANALEYAGYECRFEFGTGGHTLAHGGTLFADSIRWLLK